MLSGFLNWNSGYLNARGVGGYFWASTPAAYTGSRILYFVSTNVNPKDNYGKPNGMALRCVARFFRTSTYAQKIIATFLPELSAASLFRL